MSKTFTYTFSTPANSNLSIVTSDNAQPVNSTSYSGFYIQSITGTFNGENIQGIYGASGQTQNTSNGAQYDNTVDTSYNAQQNQPPVDGIDNYGFAFTTTSGALYSIQSSVDGTTNYTRFDTPSSTNRTSGAATISSTNYNATVCYCSGTLIRVARGGAEVDVAVEHLAVGDLAVTAAGARKPIRWIGHRHVDCTRHPDPGAVWPVRISADAVAPGVPARDLLVSPGHALCLDLLGEVLIPAYALLNGLTVAQQEVEAVTYWHVELEGGHDILLAENMPAESYLDMGNRGFFAGASVVDLAGTPDTKAGERTHADFCRPFHDAGPFVAVAQQQLRARVPLIGWRLLQPATWDGVALIVDGDVLLPKSRDLTACFILPADARDIWLTCPTSVPGEVGDNSDNRRLGLCLTALRFDDGLETREVALDDPLLCSGFHRHQGDHRWTAGRARLPAALLDGMEGPVFLRLDLLAPPLPRWVAPEVGTVVAGVQAA